MKLHTVKKQAVKAAALLLAAATALGAGMLSGTNVHAAENISVIDTTKTGSLTIERLEGTGEDASALEGVVFTAYKVMSLTKEDGKIVYTAESDAFGEVLGDVTPENLGDKSTAEMQELVDALSAVADKGAGKSSQPADGKNVISGMDLGLYLVVETETPAGYMASRPFLAAIPMADNYDTADAAGTKWNYNVEAKAKNEKIGLKKELAEGQADVAGAGSYINYVITTTIPAYGSEYFVKDKDGNPGKVVFTISDTMSDGLEIRNEGEHKVKVTVDGEEAAEGEDTYTLEAENKTGEDADLLITFHSDYIRDNGGKEVVVTYAAQMTAEAEMGTKGNTNKAHLAYTNKPGTDASGNPYTDNDTPDETVTVYAFGIKVVKFETEGGIKKVLPKAKFALYEDGELEVPAVKDADGEAAVLVADEKGTLEFPVLDEGTYYLKEVESPAGYTLLANPVVVEITAERDEAGKATGTFTLKVNGEDITEVTDDKDDANKFTTTLSKEIETATDEGEGGTATTVRSTGLASIAVENHRGFSLPSTGGMGIALFLAVGAAGIIVLSIVMTRKPKKQN